MKLWRHVIINTRCAWLHGDPRGFRSREHRIHSSGDYKNPPPRGEHAGLYRWHRERSFDPVEFDMDVRIHVVREFVQKMLAESHRIIACSCSDKHLHALIELPLEYPSVKREIGKAKQKVSHFLRDILPGSIWSEGGEYKPIRDASHLKNTYGYIRNKQESGAVVWSHAKGED